MVSVVCTNYNKGDWIKEAIESFLRQKTEFSFEIILIDDKSTDKSTDIIKEYSKKYPEKIRAYYNKKNLGITRTWKKVCKKAIGKYIARCDGDDYWTDDYKLQKQVKLLENSKNGSRWCSTDYDTIDSNGAVTHRFAVKNNIIGLPKSYAEMFVTKGLTMSSTWLVKTELMREINEELSDSAVDDTFNIQLDLFNRTTLTFLPDSTTVFRMNMGSDSRPVDNDAIHDRDERLLKTQHAYLEKYKDVDYKEIIYLLLRQSIEDDQRKRDIDQQKALIESQRNIIRREDETILRQNNALQQQNDQMMKILSSKRYRIGSTLAKPLSVVKRITRRTGGHKSDRLKD